MGIVIFDLEGVLIDNSKRLRYALNRVGARSIDNLSYPLKSKFWKIFLDRQLAYRMDKVNKGGIKLLLDKAKKYEIVIISGSPCNIAMDHIEKIKQAIIERGENVDFKHIYCRRRTREKAPDFKERIIKMLMEEDQIIEIHDDDERVLERAKKYGIKCYLWKNLRPSEY